LEGLLGEAQAVQTESDEKIRLLTQTIQRYECELLQAGEDRETPPSDIDSSICIQGGLREKIAALQAERQQLQMANASMAKSYDAIVLSLRQELSETREDHKRELQHVQMTLQSRTASEVEKVHTDVEYEKRKVSELSETCSELKAQLGAASWTIRKLQEGLRRSHEVLVLARQDVDHYSNLVKIPGDAPERSPLRMLPSSNHRTPPHSTRPCCGADDSPFLDRVQALQLETDEAKEHAEQQRYHAEQLNRELLEHLKQRSQELDDVHVLIAELLKGDEKKSTSIDSH
jgi:gas vesicle protein